ncbi:MAG: aldo/keto reductase [Propionibacteriaceae bacterium]|jgi:aryl-alcohol dehydrogenase-like predicted oxidoreductase|nr:aldo/keto reductase [Propionibacteriaceae bacterium]
MTRDRPRGVDRCSLALGAAQFGQVYGLANQVGAVAGPAARELVAAAWEGGIHEFDTAAAYGDSELVLGQALKTLGLADQATVITKVKHLDATELADPAAGARAVAASVEQSLRRLGLERIPVVLFHQDADARYLDVLLSLRDRGLIERVGVSCGHDPAAAVRRVGHGGVQALQLPANILDDRHLVGGSFAAARDHGVSVYVRSVYLQGLLVMPENDIPGYLAGVLPARRALDRLAGEVGIPSIQLVLRAMFSLPGAVSLLVGATTAAEVRANCAAAAAGPLPPDVLALLNAQVPRPAESVYTPAAWPQLAEARGTP